MKFSISKWEIVCHIALLILFGGFLAYELDAHRADIYEVKHLTFHKTKVVIKESFKRRRRGHTSYHTSFQLPSGEEIDSNSRKYYGYLTGDTLILPLAKTSHGVWVFDESAEPVHIPKAL